MFSTRPTRPASPSVPMALQKIVYFCHVWALIEPGRAAGQALLRGLGARTRASVFVSGVLRTVWRRTRSAAGRSVLNSADRRQAEVVPVRVRRQPRIDLLARVVAIYGRLSAAVLARPHPCSRRSRGTRSGTTAARSIPACASTTARSSASALRLHSSALAPCSKPAHRSAARESCQCRPEAALDLRRSPYLRPCAPYIGQHLTERPARD